MSRGRAFLITRIFVCGTILWAGLAGAQTTDRISAFDSKITVDRDRTMHVQEKFEIANDSGLFDSGIHRRLGISPASAQRAKPGSYEIIGARIDGHDAVLHTSEDRDVLDVGIATQAGTFPRGNHVIELTYTAKYQFAIYDSSEDLNRGITDVWPVPLGKATIELNLPKGIPEETDISAATGTFDHSQFDCVRTPLPSGVRFETTHSLPPGSYLLISARFPHPGYFISDAKEGGFRAVRENHRNLVPWLASLCGLLVFIAAGVIVWRRAPRTHNAPSGASADDPSSPGFWREVIKVYCFPMVMFGLAIAPGLNFTYSLHNGISWFFAPLGFPWVLVRILLKIAKGSEASRRRYKRFFKLTIPSYIVIALPLSWAASTSIHMTFGMRISTWTFFAVMVSPFPWWYLT
jgi:hypothetical protein